MVAAAPLQTPHHHSDHQDHQDDLGDQGDDHRDDLELLAEDARDVLGNRLLAGAGGQPVHPRLLVGLQAEQHPDLNRPGVDNTRTHEVVRVGVDPF